MRDTILFMDDLPERAALAYQRMTKEDREHTIWCKSASECVSVLKDYAEILKRVYLDHDLGGDEVTHPGNDNSGMAVVRYLEHADRKLFDGCMFIVHTHNEYAGLKMNERLRAAGYKSHYAPFGERKL